MPWAAVVRMLEPQAGGRQGPRSTFEFRSLLAPAPALEPEGRSAAAPHRLLRRCGRCHMVDCERFVLVGAACGCGGAGRSAHTLAHTAAPGAFAGKAATACASHAPREYAALAPPRTGDYQPSRERWLPGHWCLRMSTAKALPLGSEPLDWLTSQTK